MLTGKSLHLQWRPVKGRELLNKDPTEGWQDKSAHGALRSDGCFCLIFWHSAHRASRVRTARPAAITLYFLAFLRRMEPDLGR